METIELQLDKQTLDRARWLAEAEPPKDRILGMFADEPEIVDEILEEIMSDRAAHPLHL